MNRDLIVKKLIDIDADCSRVWEALTTPEIVKQYFFGTELISDFKVGGEIIFQGDWEGKKYRDKGIILKIIPEEIHWIRDDQTMLPGEKRDYLVRIRYRQPLQEATLQMTNEGMFVVFKKLQRGIAPGQFAAWYDKDELLGSGVINW